MHVLAVTTSLPNDANINVCNKKLHVREEQVH